MNQGSSIRLLTRSCQAFLLVLGSLSLSGCDQGGEPGAVTKAQPGRVAAEPQRPGDPERGRDALLNRAIVTCGLPVSAYRKSVGEIEPDLLLADRTGFNAQLPYSLTAHEAASGVELVTSNCLSCHAARLNGELVIGLGNEFLDMTADPIVSVESAGAYVTGEADAAEWRKWADRINAIAPYMMTDTVGVNSANNLTLALFAHRDPKTLAWSDEPLLEPPPEKPLPVSVPPWWNMRKKHASFYNAEGRGDQVRLMMLASTTCTDTVQEAADIDAWFVDVRAYLMTLQPPPYPYAVEQALADRGERLFNKNLWRRRPLPEQAGRPGGRGNRSGAGAGRLREIGPLHPLVEQLVLRRDFPNRAGARLYRTTVGRRMGDSTLPAQWIRADARRAHGQREPPQVLALRC